MDIALLAALIILNGAFALSEIALVTARSGLLQARQAEGDAAAGAALRLRQEPTRFLSTVQIGITSIGVLNGIVGEAALAPAFGDWLRAHGLEAHTAHWLSTGIVVVLVTYFSIVVGELVPKRLGQIHAEAAARLVARPMLLLAALAKPFVRLLTGSTNLVLRAFGVREEGARGVTEEEIQALLFEGSQSGVIEKDEHAMVRNVFRLDDRQIGSLMVPRSDVVCLDVERPWDEIRGIIAESGHSRFPVVRGGLANILGVTSARRLLQATLSGGAPDLAANLQPAVFVPETLTGMELLQNFRGSGTQFAFVVDEYGEVLGIVTLRDLLEAITGEFVEPRPEDRWAVRRDDGSWLLDGLIPVPELKDRLNLRDVPEEGRYHTLSGMLLLLLGRVPQTADHAQWRGWRFEVVDMDGKRIDKVLAVPLPPSLSEDAASREAGES